jgi:hypothetical protein
VTDIRIVNGSPDDDELAALVAALELRQAAAVGQPQRPRPAVSEWTGRGPAAWRFGARKR